MVRTVRIVPNILTHRRQSKDLRPKFMQQETSSIYMFDKSPIFLYFFYILDMHISDSDKSKAQTLRYILSITLIVELSKVI